VSPSATAIATGIELILMAGGLCTIWRLALSPAARANRPPPQLAAWTIPGVEFMRFLLLVICATLTGNLVGAVLVKLRPLGPDAKAMFLTAWSHVGMLAGVAAFKLGLERIPLRGAAVQAHDFRNGAVTYLIALPTVTAVNIAWHETLKAAGIPPEKQELVSMFVNTHSPLLLALMIVLATITAPIAEELIFRAGLFRFMRTRMPRWAALLLPVCVWAALHQNLASFVPLIALGLVLSLAYERTGRVWTVIVAHMLFNLSSLVLVLLGVGT
jgi:membrane protease YdiL (CAAX protease family)